MTTRTTTTLSETRALPTRWTYAIDNPPDLPADKLAQLLGGKAANLAMMSTQLGLPVPPAFTISTAACREYLQSGWPAGLDRELRGQIRRLGNPLGRHFASTTDPLLVSVRSGAPVSMPGMMDTILDLGISSNGVAGLATETGNVAVARDCLRRFRAMYRETVGEEAPDDPWLQLRGAIEAVFRSWNSDRAIAYRAHEGIPDDMGTAVTVQAMVFGNRGRDSATGVLFTRNPASGDPVLYGDVMFNAQGEDVVAGTHRTQPLRVLDTRMPAVAAELRRYSDALERHFADLCDIEFTIERGKLWMLQVRVGKRSPRAALRIAIDMANDPTFPCSRADAVHRTLEQLADPPRVFTRSATQVRPMTVGLGASPGIAAGQIVTTPEEAVAAAEAGHAAILVRHETSPEDVHGIARAAGVLTARGGLASHAAVVARGWGIPAIVGARDVQIEADRVAIAGRTLPAGARITIDGETGEVFEDDVVGAWTMAPQAATLLGWAEELGIEIPRPTHGVETRLGAKPEGEAVFTGTAGVPDGDDLLRVLLVKGMATSDHIAEALGCEPATIGSLFAAAEANGLAEGSADGCRLTPEGRLAALAVFAHDAGRLGPDRAATLLGAFHALDLRMKEAVTAWQLRDAGNPPVLNDHADAAYDTAVLDRMDVIHADTISWLAPLATAFDRYAGYRTRLTSALRLARAGDQRFVASPRVDSYHTVWFELHEDLIRLAGLRRSDEATNG